jgi:LCP family protein required for cell wall assembly
VQGQEGPPGRRYRPRQVAAFVLALLGLAACEAVLAAVVFVRVAAIFLPGSHPSLPLPAPVQQSVQGLGGLLPGLGATPSAPVPPSTPIDILILGLDRRPHHDPAVDGPPNSDAIEILRLDPQTHAVTLLAIPRDLYVLIPSPKQDGQVWEGRINTAYHDGEAYGYPGGGPALARSTIESTFHVPIDYYVVVDWVAFADVVDALGGIDVDVPAPLHHVEAFNPRTFDTRYIDIPAGEQHMDAVTALAYARFRDDSENDFGRVHRQQQVMQAAAAEALQFGWLGRAPQLYLRFRNAVQTDLPLVRLPMMLSLLRDVDLDQVTATSVAGPSEDAVRSVISPWGEDVLVPIWDKMAPIIRAAMPDREVQAEGARVTVVNDTGVPDTGQRTAEYLTRFALTPEQVTTVEDTAGQRPRPAPTTSLVVTGNAMVTAERIADWLGIPQSRISQAAESPPTQPGEVSVLLGSDVKLPNDEAFQHFRLHP